MSGTSLPASLGRLRRLISTYSVGAIVAAVLLPAVAGWVAVVALGDRNENLTSIKAAVVNLDEPVMVKRDGTKQLIFGGRVLAADLTTEEKDLDLGWTLTSASDASEGFRDGRFAAVVTIPAGFSQQLATVGSADPRPATVDVQAHDVPSPLTSIIATQLTDQAARSFGYTVTTNYLTGVREQSGKLRDNLARAAGGASDLADGASRLESGAGELSNGLTHVSAGTSQLADGTRKLSAGSTRLASGARQASVGATSLYAGTTKLSTGLGRLTTSTADLPSQTQELSRGATTVAEGASSYAALVKGWAQACASPAVALTEPQLCGLTKAAAGPNGTTADRFSSGASAVAAGATKLSHAMPRLTSGIRDAYAGSVRVNEGARALRAGNASIASGAASLRRGSVQVDSGASSLATGSRRLTAGSRRLETGAGRLSSGSHTLSGRLSKGAGAVPELSKDQPTTVARPVRSDAGAKNFVNGRSLLVPGVTALALWLGAFAVFLLMDPIPRRRLLMAVSAGRLTGEGLRPAVLAGAVQAGLVLVAVRALGTSLAHPVATVVVALIASFTFAAVHQALIATWGRGRGWLASLLLVIVQFVSLGGLLPSDTAPQPFELLNHVLPVPLAVDALNGAALGVHDAHVAGCCAGLILWLVASLGLTVLATKRAQQVRLEGARDKVLAGGEGLAVG